MAFCKAMNNFTVNEKGNITNSLEGSADKCLGMVNLWNNAIGKRGGGKGGGKGGKGFGKGFGKGGNNSSCEIDENKLNETVDFIWDTYKPHFEQALGVEVKDYNNCYVHAFQCGDSSWTHQDYMDYSAIVYINPITHWDLRKWGGETLYFNDELDV